MDQNPTNPSSPSYGDEEEISGSQPLQSPTAVPRYLALDVGDRRIGLAISDPLGYTAQPLFTIHRRSLRADLKDLGRVLRRHDITDVIIGHPVHLSGEISPQALKTQSFAAAFKQQHPNVRVHLVDERLTTSEAHSLLDRQRPKRAGARERTERRAIIDQVAAVVLLEAFLSAGAPRLLPPPPEDLDPR